MPTPIFNLTAKSPPPCNKSLQKDSNKISGKKLIVAVPSPPSQGWLVALQKIIAVLCGTVRLL